MLYVDLVNTICEKENWKKIVDILKQSKNLTNIECMSIPTVVDDDTKPEKTAILNWWREMEQNQIALSLKYSVLLQTDISDCYGSIYTHSLAWALHGKELAKENRKDNSLLGNKLDFTIQNIRQGQTNGIPQGSIIMDLIAEIILCAIDIELENKITESTQVKEYKILRYIDDYKIFTNSKLDAEILLKILSETLMLWNFKLNEKKTSISENVIIDSIKEDKLYWNKYNEIFEKENNREIIQKELLEILKLSQNYPNSGSISTALSSINNNKISKLSELPSDYLQIIAIITEIMLKNPRTIPVSISIISQILYLLDGIEVKEIIENIYKKVSKSAYSELTEIWIQRLVLPYDIEVDFESLLCKKVTGEENIIWESSWINGNYKGNNKEIKFKQSIINQNGIDKLDMVIEAEEVDYFIDRY